MAWNRYFLIVFSALYTGLMTLIGLDLLILNHAGEYADLDRLIDEQNATGGVYNGFVHSLAEYKYLAYAKRQPEIVAIGTSRAMQIRDMWFTRPFYNLGGLVQGPQQANAIADRLLLSQPPKVVIFMLDFWTFCGKPEDPLTATWQAWHDGEGRTNRYFAPLILLGQGRLAPRDFIRLAMSNRSNQLGELHAYGISAVLNQAGFRPDGSLSEGPKSTSERPVADLAERWVPTFHFIDAGSDKFGRGCIVSDQALNALQAFMGRMKDAHVSVVLMLAPLPGAVLDYMATNGDYTYIDSLRTRLAARYPGRFYDFTDMRSIGGRDREFYDGIHGGQSIYARLIADASAHKDDILASWVDRAGIARSLEGTAEDTGTRRP